MKEYYPPHLTGHGSRGLGALALVLFAQDEHCKLRPAVSVFGLKGRGVDLDLVTD